MACCMCELDIALWFEVSYCFFCAREEALSTTKYIQVESNTTSHKQTNQKENLKTTHKEYFPSSVQQMQS